MMVENRVLFSNYKDILSVSELTRKIKGQLETEFSMVWVEGDSILRTQLFYAQGC